MINAIVKRFAARPVADIASSPRPLAKGLWTIERAVRFPGGAQMPARSTVVRLGDGGLVVLSAPPLDDAGAAALADLGPVRAVVAPNTFHYLFAPALLQRFPDAAFWGSPGLATRVPDLAPVLRELGSTPPPGWAGVLEYATLQSAPDRSETVFFHAPSRTLILTDLAFAPFAFVSRLQKVRWRAFGIPRDFGPARTSRYFLLRDRAKSAALLRRIQAWPFERIVVAHGDVIDRDAHAVFRAGFKRYLRA